MKRIVNLKIFEDNENVMSVKFSGDKGYALAHSGQLKVFTLGNELHEEKSEHLETVSGR